MIRKIVSIAMCVVGLFSASAQQPQLTPLPLNPKVKTGVLPNGLTYFVMHNEEPKERANFYIAQKVGSTLETEDQLGLAHFLEHMAFNGTTHYPGKSMLDYLQSKGIRFGADINAYTNFDETVYNINNVPTTDKNLMDSVLLVLHDWSGEILLEEAEIDAERGVIEGEWRQRNNANFRMYSSILPKIYEEYQYQQMPIGKMEIVRNFKPEVLRAYYKKWYRPDQQGIVVVGDFDADEMEKKVIDMFSSIPMPENAAPRVYPIVSDNVEPIYTSFTDPELGSPVTIVSFKSDVLPPEIRNTLEMYVNKNLVEMIVGRLFNLRLSDFAQTAECNYANASVDFGNYYVSKTKDAFDIQIIPKPGKTQEAVADAMGIVARACKTGFTDSELQRVKDDIVSMFEKSYNERDKTDNDSYGRELYRYFIDNDPAPGIETEYEIVQNVMPMLPVEAINERIKMLLTAENMVIVTAEPQKDGFEIVGKEVMVKTVSDAMNAEYEAYVDEVITEPLIAQLPAPGKITNVETNPQLGITTFTLSNGAKVVLKPTDFAGDEIILTAFREGGKRLYAPEQGANVLLMDDAFSISKMGPFDNKTLRKYLAGKHASVGFSVNNYTDVLNGMSTVKDLETLMQLVYTSFTNLNADQENYTITIDKIKPQFELMKNNPQSIFFNQVAKTIYGNNPLMERVTIETLEKADYPTMLDMVHAALSNAAEYTFILTGNIDVEAIKPLIEQYVASLPSAKVAPLDIKSDNIPVKGQVNNEFTQAMQEPATFVYDVISGDIKCNPENDVKVTLMGNVLDIIYTATLREEEGGTYGASVGAQTNPNTDTWQLLYYFVTNKDQQAQLISRAQAELEKMLKEGTDEETFQKVKEAKLKQLEINERTNAYWDDNLLAYLRGYDTITGYRQAIENLTLADFNAFMKGIYDGKNRIEIVMEGTPVAE